MMKLMNYLLALFTYPATEEYFEIDDESDDEIDDDEIYFDK